MNVEETVKLATNNFSKILSTQDIINYHKELYWGGNGLGDRFANKKFNYTVIYSKKTNLYSENNDDEIPVEILENFLKENFLKHNKGTGIIGIFVHSIRTNVQKRPIQQYIQQKIRNLSCVVCGTQNTICDHKNDLYNDERVLSLETQLITDFQPLCNHCNLQKGQINKEEKKKKKVYSAKNIRRYAIYPFEFPWEKRTFDILDINTKYGTFWYDPVKFDKNIYLYSTITLPIIKEIKQKVKSKFIKLVE